MSVKVRRGDIFFVDIPNRIGSEQRGMRPALIIQNNLGNMFSPTTIVAVISSKIEKKDRLPTHVLLDRYSGMPVESIVMFEQIYTIDKSRLGRFICSIKDEEAIKALDHALSISLDV